MNSWKKKKISNQSKKRPLSSQAFSGSLGYFITRALINIRQNIFVNVVTIGTITLALLIISLFLLVFVNVEKATESWSERVQVTTYFDRELSSQEQISLQQKVMAIPGAAKVRYVPKNEALKRFKDRLKGQETLLEGVLPEVMPTSFEISLKRSYRDSQGVEAFVSTLRKVAGINEIQYGEEWVRRFNAFLNFCRMLGALLGCLLIVVVVFIVSNTIKLTIYARRDELEVMSLVGASRFFIQAPFLIEGIVQGATGSLLSLLFLFGLYEAFLHNASSFLSFNPVTASLSFLPFEYGGAIIISGILLGFIGSLTSLKRFITI